MLDLVISGGLVFDGLGSPPVRRDIGIKADRIARIGERITETARETRDATGLWVMPGFVDIHTHYDLEVEIAPALSESVRHGVTTVVMGNCSLSLTLGAPEILADIFLRVETLPAALVRKWLATSVSWDSPQAYLEHLESLKLGPNTAPMLGHSALRAAVMGLKRSLHDFANGAELDAMRRLAEESLETGCIGISVDRVHWHKMSGAYAGRAVPSHYADYREYKMLADVCREHDAVFQVTPNPQNWKSFVAILWLSLGLFRPPLRVTVLAALDMVGNKHLWRMFPLVLFIFNRVLGGNLRFQTLTEPFTLYSDGPLTPLFEEFASGVRLNNAQSTAERQALWKELGFREAFRRDWCRSGPKTFHRDFAQMVILRAPDEALIGKTIAAVARERNADPLETWMELLEAYDDRLRWVSTGANQRPAIRRRLMAHPHILPGFTDAGAHGRNLAYFDGALSLLREAVSSGFLSPQRAIQRVTGEPARWFNLEAGVLREGAQADIVLLRPENLGKPGAAPVEIADPVLDGATRMVKRGSTDVVESVYIAGSEVLRAGHPLPVLGQEKLGRVLSAHKPVRGKKAVGRRYRNRISDELMDHPLTNYWEIFVLKHQHPGNLALHCIAVLMMYAIVLWAGVAGNPWLLLLVPLSQITGLAGHILFERSHVDIRDLVFSWRAMACLHRLFFELVAGRYGREVERVNRQLSDGLTP